MSEVKTILVTGGLGYIGSHTVVELYNKDYLNENKMKNEYDVVIVDDCSTCSEKILPILESMVGKKIPFYKVSIIDKKALEEPFKKHKIYSVIHFAGKKAVGESVENPLLYYENNFIGTFNLIELCLKYKVNNFIFSSSCTVYVIGMIVQKKMIKCFSQLILMEDLNFSLSICLKIQQQQIKISKLPY
jgi:UDP-glucose 4-epimerase